ncbi:MAG: bifunctional homocysteine S-methyltransferase/methylenetetrahydrofolate reductase, partial [Candidatus Electryoneaceae bacterium]|nr:bifunctional homocysteine S-methyltransferase/methylenetetrahydrofolate reductase [Candidatus Electryoneaceae bacterium]
PHGLGEAVIDLNRRGAVIARQAMEKSGRNAFIAGSIGPLGQALAPLGTVQPEEAFEIFAEQTSGLVEGGVDLISIETMTSTAQLIQAVKAVRSISDLPLIAQFTLSDWNESAYGATLDRICSQLSQLDADAIGINCSLGPNKLLEAAKVLVQHSNLPIIIQPNAGELEHLEGRLISRSTPEYFAEYTKRLLQVGVKMIGGCCGSTPAHIRAMDAAMRAVTPELSKVSVSITPSAPPVHTEASIVKPYRELSQMAADLEDGHFVFSVEINPPRSPLVGGVIKRVKQLKENGINLVNIPDGPRASARMSAMILAQEIHRHVDIDVMPHYTCRDRNILGMQSDLLGAELLGVKNILCVTGDPPKLGDYPMATAVFDVDAIGLLHIADNLNYSLDLAGNPLSQGTSFHLGCGANPGALDLDHEIDRLHRKIDNGARYVLTQPVFEEDVLFQFLDKADIKVPVLVGILPLVSYRNAEFFHHEVPGMQVPDHIRDRLKPITDREQSALIGIQIAADALIRTAPIVAGAYIMPPFGKVELALKVIDIFRHSDYGKQRLSRKD